MGVMTARRVFHQPIALQQSGTDITTGLKAYWKFDEGSGTSAADSSGNGHTITTMGPAIWDSDGTGNFMLATSGSGIPQIADHADFCPGTAYTVFAWCKSAIADAGLFYINKSDFNADQRSWTFRSDNSDGSKLNVVLYEINASGGNNKSYTSSLTAFSTGAWKSLAFRWLGGVLDLFVNGAIDPSPTKTSDNTIAGNSVVRSTTMPLCFGAIGFSAGADSAFGNIGAGSGLRKVRLYTRGLSNADIAALHALGN